MPTRDRFALTHRIDWADDGSFAHPHSDVSQPRVAMRESHGASPQSNPSRPTLLMARGRLIVQGPQFIPDQPGALTLAQVSGNHRYRVTMRDGMTDVVVFDGLVSGGRVDDYLRGVASFTVHSSTEASALERRAVAQTSSTANANDAAVVQLAADALGVASIGSLLRATPLDQYSWNERDGAGSAYLSEFAKIAGGMPIQRRDGSFTLIDPTLAGPADALTISPATHLMLDDVQSEFADAHLRNVGVVRYSQEGSSVSRSITGEIQYFQNTPLNQQHVASLPDLDTGETITGVHFVAGTIMARNNPTSLSPLLVLRPRPGDVNNDRVPEITTNSGMYTEATNSYRINAVGRNWSSSDPYRWRSAPGQPNSHQNVDEWYVPNTPGNPAQVWYIYLPYTIEYTLNLAATIEDVTVQNFGSIAIWGQRTLDFRPWFRQDSVAAVQDRIDDLSVVRRIHRVPVSLWQRSRARSVEIAELDAGDHIALNAHDRSTGLDIAARCLVLSTELVDSQNASPYKLLTCIETGHGIEPNYVYLGAGTDNPVHVGGEQVALR